MYTGKRQQMPETNKTRKVIATIFMNTRLDETVDFESEIDIDILFDLEKCGAALSHLAIALAEARITESIPRSDDPIGSEARVADTELRGRTYRENLKRIQDRFLEDMESEGISRTFRART
jgi:hypothetical protein